MMKSLLKKLTLHEWRNRDPGAPDRKPASFPSSELPMKPPTGWTWPPQPSNDNGNGKKAKSTAPNARPAPRQPEVVIRHYVEHDPTRPTPRQPELVIRHYVEPDPHRPAPQRPAPKYRRNRPGRRGRQVETG